MAEKRVTIEVKGKSPLLTHNPASMGGGAGTASKTKKIPTPEEEAAKGVYKIDGGFAIPGIGFRNALIAASGAWKPPKGKGSMKIATSHVVVEPELVLIRDGDGQPAKKYGIDTRRAVVQRQGILRSRPRFDEWSAKFDVVYDDALIEPGVITDIMRDAGTRIGVGDYRPQKSGWFGRFEVV